MPIDSSKFEDSFLKWMDKDDGDFVGYPDIESKAIDLWADGLKGMCTAITPTSVVSVAESAFRSAAVGMSNTVTGGVTLVNALNAFATALANSMVGYSPTNIPVFTLVDLTMAVPSSNISITASTIAAQIDAKMKTGVSTLIAPPFTSQSWI